MNQTTGMKSDVLMEDPVWNGGEYFAVKWGKGMVGGFEVEGYSKDCNM